MIKEIKTFFEMKYKHLVLRVLVSKNHQIAYIGDDFDMMTRYLTYQSKLEEFEEELARYIETHLDLFEVNDLDALAQQPEYLVTTERQRELSKEIVDRSYSIEDLYKMID